MATRTPPPAAGPHAWPDTPNPQGRTTMPAGKVLVVMVVCLLVWGFLDAPSLKRSSEAQPLGTRRTVSLWVLSPLAAISNVLQITRVTDVISNALGKNPNAAPGGVIAPDPDPIPSGSASPTEQPKPPTKTGPIRVPTPSDKLRVVVVGDSLAAGLGVYTERALRPSLTRVTKQGRISTGLSRPDYFSWPDAMQEIEDGFRPDLVVVMLGVNDNQGLQTPGGRLETPIGTFEWPQAYQQRVQDFANIAIDNGAHVVWVGLPIVRDKSRWPLFRRQNQIYQRVADATPNMTYVDTWDRFATPDGDYTAFYRDGDHLEEIRGSDGIHFTGLGYEIVARAAIDAAVNEFKLTSKVLQD